MAWEETNMPENMQDISSLGISPQRTSSQPGSAVRQSPYNMQEKMIQSGRRYNLPLLPFHHGSGK